MKTKLIFILLLGFSMWTTATAQVCAPAIGQTQIRQQQRIHQGVRQGDLTRREAWQLKRQQGKIQYMKRQAWADGRITRGEKARIRAAQHQANRHIAVKKHNRRDRF